ncbi:MAG: oxidoreductase, partial [Chloroflexi bacterium]|nr:oxidoreductase [Chloroflexota bacterium]
GYSKDPITAFGISDSFRDAELLADAIDDGLSGRRPYVDAMADYERNRNEAAAPLYQLTLNAARYNQHTPNALQLRAALHGRADIDNYIGVITGSIAIDEFFNEQNIQRILSGA